MSFVKENLPHTIEALKADNNFSYCAESAFLTREFLVPFFLEKDPDSFLKILSTGRFSRMLLNSVFRDKNITQLVANNNAIRKWIVGLNFGDSLFDLDDEFMLSLIKNEQGLSDAARAMMPNRLWFPFKAETVVSSQFQNIMRELQTRISMKELQFMEEYLNSEPLKLKRLDKDQKKLYMKMCADVIPSHLKQWLLQAEGLDSTFLHSVSDLDNFPKMLNTCLYSESSNDNTKQAGLNYQKEKFGVSTHRTSYRYFKSEAEYLNYAESLPNVNISLLMEGANSFNKPVIPRNVNFPDLWVLKILERRGEQVVYLSENNSVKINTYLTGLNVKHIECPDIQDAFIKDIALVFPEVFSDLDDFSNLPLSRVLDVIKTEIELTSKA